MKTLAQALNRAPEEGETVTGVDAFSLRLRVVCQNCGRVARIAPLTANAPGTWQSYEVDAGAYMTDVWLCPPCVGRGATVRLWA